MSQRFRFLSLLVCSGALWASVFLPSACVSRDQNRSVVVASKNSANSQTRSLAENIKAFVTEGLTKHNAATEPLRKKLIGLSQFLNQGGPGAAQFAQSCAVGAAVCGILWVRMSLPVQAAPADLFPDGWSERIKSLPTQEVQTLVQDYWKQARNEFDPKWAELQQKLNESKDAALKQMGETSDTVISALDEERLRFLNFELARNMALHIPANQLTSQPDYSQMRAFLDDELFYNYKEADLNPDLSKIVELRLLADDYQERETADVPINKATKERGASSADGKKTVKLSGVTAGEFDFLQSGRGSAGKITTLRLNAGSIAFTLQDGNGKYTEVAVCNDFDEFGRPTKFYLHPLAPVLPEVEVRIDGATEKFDGMTFALPNTTVLRVDYEGAKDLQRLAMKLQPGDVRRPLVGVRVEAFNGNTRLATSVARLFQGSDTAAFDRFDAFFHQSSYMPTVPAPEPTNRQQWVGEQAAMVASKLLSLLLGQGTI